MQEYLRRLLKDKARLRKWKRIMIALSCIVVVCTVYALSLPAQTLACDKEEHTHTAECYDENNELICEKEEHTHTDDCNKQEEVNEQEEVVKDEPETINNDEQVSQASEEEETTTTTTTETTKQPFDLSSEANKDKITDVQFTYKKDGVVVKPGQSVDVSTQADLSMTYKLWFKDISATILKQCGGIIKYQLPGGFKIRNSIQKNIVEGNDILGTMDVNKDGLVTITYNTTFLSGLSDNQTLTGDFEVDAQIDMNKIDSSTGKVTITTPKGDITLNYGLDYKEHYGNVEVDKSWEKEATSDYIKYTITLKAGEDGCKNVYVVDQFTQGKDLVKYEDINLTENTLNPGEYNHQPYETRDNNSKAGTIYKTNAPSSDQTIPDAVMSISNPESFVWKIDEMNPNEVRKLTYYVKLIDTTQNLYHKKTNVVNNAQVYSKRDNSSQVYSKGNKESTFTPTIVIDTSVMKKNIVKQDDNKDYKKDAEGNYLVNYQIEFNYGSNNNVSIKGFQFADYLDYVDDYDFKTDSKMLPYISFVENSIVLHVKTAGESGYKEYTGNDISVKWAKGNDTYSTTYKEDSTRFKVYELNNKSITINPGDSYYVTYTLKIKPEVYAAMQSNSVNIKNRYYTYSTDKELNKIGNTDLTLSEYKWVDKDVAKPTTSEETINMDGKKYNNQFNEDTSAEQSFKVPAGSYKYTVKLNKTDGKFNITDVTLTDTLDKDVMKYVGYMKIMAYDTQNNVVETKWVNIDKQQNFSLRLSDIDWTNNCYSYTFEYYATPNDLSSLTSAKVTNTFSLNGDVKRGLDGETFTFTNVSSSSEVTLEGSYNLNVNKQAWYYEKPKQNATEWQNGKHYWVIEVNGSKIRKDTQIKDEISDALGKDEISSYLHKDSLVGVYKGNLKTLSEYKTIDNLPEKLRVSESYYTADYTNKKGFSGDNNYSELVLTAKKDIDLQENEKIYIVVSTEPQELPTEYRATSIYKNSVYVKHINDADYTKYDEASQELYGGNYILKELGQTFEYKNGKYKNISKGKDIDDPESKIVKEKLNGDGIFASWAFKVNYGGDLNGDYRVLETIPDGMELSYIRIKWTGKYAKNITSKQITNLGDDWKENTITAPDDDHSNITTTYYVNGKQALIQLGSFQGIHARDDYSVDVQVVCRVTDPDVLLGGKTKTFTNEVMLQSPDGTKDYVSANASAEISKIKILDKTNIHNDKSPKIDYTITANEYGQTLLKNTTDKLTLVDDLSPNLVLDPDSIKAKNIKNKSDVPIETKYDPEKNILEIQIPDGTPVQIQYSCKVKVAPKTDASVSNRVYWKNYGQTGGVNDEIKTFSYDLNASGTTETETHPELKIIKYDDTLKRLSGAEFEIHECILENNEIKRTSKKPFTVISDTDGSVTIKTSEHQMEFNTIYEVKETKTVDGYILDGNSYYIMRAKKEDSRDYSDYVKKYIEYQNSRDKHYIVAYDKDYFLVKIFNAQKGITVQKAFKNNAAETEHNPISGTYRFGLYDNAEGSGDALEIISIHYDPKDKDVKSAKFKNPIDLTKDYYVFEIGQNNQPIKASDDEATINSMQYKVVYNNETNNTETNSAKVGETVTVTNKSRTKILPSTGSVGTLIYRLLGATLVVASLICLSNINKNNR
ncbi:prealbumin-like fold domain-containing protein, partial [Holdemanella biformis]|uniref:prealbumin-like fold domain-containing protein n=1 Tax=Holdemanella biformis TaxID=1735 RepID=UPI003AB5C87F